ncbi:MAG TPA: hypothetical protein VK804_02765 [Bradyrhizobium sp.]|jgi:hypothetical protein|uniref:hypothetical protein n=1 Tax=Bradyrhizobium sp. TaxID=376 RepID=UPI002BFEACD2|nr:hypothetical protein [Bradyrhizobium sp.]HTA99372.1 hypothetical protein [Bradyrhizobium sp.]
MRILGIVALGAALAGCASSGVQVTQEQAQSFQVGKSTYGDVVAALGQPTTTTMSSAGQKYAIYSYAAVSSRPQNFIPYIGPLVSGYDTKSSAVTFAFDNRDVLVNMTSTQSNLGTGANLAAGAPQGPTAQPR